MNGATGRWSDEQVEQVLGNLLRAGVLLAAAVVLAGGVLYLYRHGLEQPSYKAFQAEPADLRSPAGIVADALAFQSRGIIMLGILLLIATPVARVVIAGFAFLCQRDVTYVIVTLMVLTVLLYSLLNGNL